MTGAKLGVRVRAAVGPAGAQEGANRGDVVIVVDALRASVTIAAALHARVRRVIPVATVQEARAYLGDPAFRVAGERGGAALPDFHLGNSPTEVLSASAELAGLVLVLTTSNGTRCIEAAAGGAYRVLIGSAVNASACARAAWTLACSAGRDVSLVGAGLGGDPASEDTHVVGLIAQRLSELGAVLAPGTPARSPAESAEVFASSLAASGLSSLGYAEDVRFCAQVDLWDTVPVLVDGAFVGLSEGGA